MKISKYNKHFLFALLGFAFINIFLWAPYIIQNRSFFYPVRIGYEAPEVFNSEAEETVYEGLADLYKNKRGDYSETELVFYISMLQNPDYLADYIGYYNDHSTIILNDQDTGIQTTNYFSFFDENFISELLPSSSVTLEMYEGVHSQYSQTQSLYRNNLKILFYLLVAFHILLFFIFSKKFNGKMTFILFTYCLISGLLFLIASLPITGTRTDPGLALFLTLPYLVFLLPFYILFLKYYSSKAMTTFFVFFVILYALSLLVTGLFCLIVLSNGGV